MCKDASLKLTDLAVTKMYLSIISGLYWAKKRDFTLQFQLLTFLIQVARIHFKSFLMHSKSNLQFFFVHFHHKKFKQIEMKQIERINRLQKADFTSLVYNLPKF